MIEEIIISYLRSKNISAYTEKPKDEKEFVVISKTGSRKVNHIKRATVTLQSYSTSLYNAALLNEQVKEAMEQITERIDVTNCTLNTDYNWTDTTTKEYRYQAVFDIVYY